MLGMDVIYIYICICIYVYGCDIYVCGVQRKFMATCKFNGTNHSISKEYSAKCVTMFLRKRELICEEVFVRGNSKNLGVKSPK